MPRNGAGTATPPAGNPVVAGTTINTSWGNNTVNDIYNELSNSIAKDGQTVITANLPMAGYHHTGVGDAQALNQYQTMKQAQNDAASYVTTVTGTGDAILLQPAFATAAYTNGQRFTYIVTADNTGAATVNVNSLGAKDLTNVDGSDLLAGQLVIGDLATIRYTGSNFVLESSGNSSRQTITVKTIADLKLISPATCKAVVIVQGYYAAGDDGSGVFYPDATSTATENGGTIIQATGVVTGRWIRLVQHDLTIRDFGAKGDDSTNDSAAYLALDATGKLVRLIDGNYKYTSTTNPTLTGGVEIINAQLNAADYDNILTVDEDGKLVGLDMNHQQDNQVSLGSNIAITSGILVSPPISKASPPDDLDIVAHWYQDFGLDWTRNGNGANGSLTWYYWTWNFTTGTYYEDRHPLFGWYRGDDPKVLDWQCYWLRESGVKAITLNPSVDVDTSAWSSATNKYHWMYQLFTNAPNFQGLEYVLWGKYTGTSVAITASWESLIDDIYLTYKNFYCVRMNNKLYPAIFVFEGVTLYSNLGGTEADSVTFFGAMANRFKAAGYGGIAIMARHPRNSESISRTALEAVDCLYFAADYSCNGAWLDLAGTGVYPVIDDATTYSAMLDSWYPLHERPEWAVGATYSASDTVIRNGYHFLCKLGNTATIEDAPGEGKNSYLYWIERGPINREIVAIPSSKYAVAPHPSAGQPYWRAAGQTPDLFRKWLNRAIDSIMTHETPPILMLYNVSEWAEGGPGLMPNKQDGFGYLNAIRNAAYRGRKPVQVTPVLPTIPFEPSETSTQFLLAATAIKSTARTVLIDLDFNRTLTATPTITAGYDGQELMLMNIDSTYRVTLQDRGTLASSGLYLTATTIDLGPLDSVPFRYVDGKGWVQTGPVTNVL